MKKILFVLMTVLGLSATAQVKMPAASPTQTLSQDFGLGKIEITYSRPGIKGRTVFGNGSLLAPYGIVWRTGANGATKITFSDAVTIGGKTLAPGDYALFTIPGEKEWTIIINSKSNISGTAYSQADDVLRVVVKSGKSASFSERMTFKIAKTGVVSLIWGDHQINFNVK